jgi:hypothetical protein
MLNSLVFAVLLAGCCGYAFLYGGPPERVGAAILAVGSILTLVAVSARGMRFHSVEGGVFLVDVAALFAFLILALYSERFWPLWVTALQAIGVAGHAVKLADPGVIWRIYAFVLAFWSYPMLLLIVIGTWNHHRRVVRFGADRSWSSFSGRSDRPRRGGPTG